jgi:hypothetical protein
MQDVDAFREPVKARNFLQRDQGTRWKIQIRHPPPVLAPRRLTMHTRIFTNHSHCRNSHRRQSVS